MAVSSNVCFYAAGFRVKHERKISFFSLFSSRKCITIFLNVSSLFNSLVMFILSNNFFAFHQFRYFKKYLIFD